MKMNYRETGLMVQYPSYWSDEMKKFVNDKNFCVSKVENKLYMFDDVMNDLVNLAIECDDDDERYVIECEIIKGCYVIKIYKCSFDEIAEKKLIKTIINPSRIFTNNMFDLRFDMFVEYCFHPILEFIAQI